jgi:aquaporin Z
LANAPAGSRDGRLACRRLLAEFTGTFLLILVACGGGVANAASGGHVGRDAAAAAPGLMVIVLIIAIGATSGAHMNPAVTVSLAARGSFPWHGVPGYILAQLAGALCAAGGLRLVFGNVGGLGTTTPAPWAGDGAALLAEIALTFGLMTVIFGAASWPRGNGHNAAIAIGGYVSLAGLWASPVSGASMNPARSLAPEVVSGNLNGWWIYILGPIAGGLLAVLLARALSGRHSIAANRAAEGGLP